MVAWLNVLKITKLYSLNGWTLQYAKHFKSEKQNHVKISYLEAFNVPPTGSHTSAGGIYAVRWSLTALAVTMPTAPS